jgi:hypothetical protein
MRWSAVDGYERLLSWNRSAEVARRTAEWVALMRAPRHRPISIRGPPRELAARSGYGHAVAFDAPSWDQTDVSTERLRLRTPTSKDADALYGLLADPEVMRGLNRDPVSDLDATRTDENGDPSAHGAERCRLGPCAHWWRASTRR